ncbi:MAG: dephospho-CoA kinase [Candidatus Omnitrophica bacterium]|nr:dephospho-CoA kinase [Candidatus Omnitrophota bacterium]MBU1810627.1 dephospho-CoA kinase [Candidatus Omnitrophota bacterium]
MGVFAITGNLTSGKSTVLKLLKNKGAGIFDIDERIHEYYKDRSSSVYKKVISTFPQVVKKHSISRRKLAGVVFKDLRQLHRLERIVHPASIRDLGEWVKRVRVKKGSYIAEVPLLFEKKLQDCFDGVILVVAKREILIERIRKKFSLSREMAIKRLSLYLSIREKIKKADFIIENDVTFRKLKEEVDSLWNKFERANSTRHFSKVFRDQNA